jgi:hypothetical protein
MLISPPSVIPIPFILGFLYSLLLLDFPILFTAVFTKNLTQAVTLKTCIREVPGSTLTQDTGNPDLFRFSVFT